MKGLTTIAEICALAALASCGGSTRSAPPSGEAVSCGPSMYILDGGCVKLPPFSDGGGPYNDGEDAESEAAPPDAGSGDESPIVTDGAADTD